MDKHKFSIKLATTIAVLMGYIFTTGQFFELVINRPMLGEFQIVLSWIWIMVSYYALKLVTTNIIDLVKHKK
jgi:hypothetical protein